MARDPVHITHGRDGMFDELVADAANVHIERMDDDHIWMMVSAGSTAQHLGATKHLHFRVRTRADGAPFIDVQTDAAALARSEGDTA